MPSHWTLRYASLRVVQYLLAILLFVTCLGKALDVEGFLNVLSTYQAFPAWSLPFVGLGIITAEGGLAVWLLSRRHLAIAALLGAILHLGYATLSVITLLRGIEVPNCGCFGVFLSRPLGWGTAGEDIFLTAWCLILFALSDQQLHAD